MDFEKWISKNGFRRTPLMVYFKLDFYCLCSLQKSSADQQGGNLEYFAGIMNFVYTIIRNSKVFWANFSTSLFLNDKFLNMPFSYSNYSKITFIKKLWNQN